MTADRTPPVPEGPQRLNQADTHTAAHVYAAAGWPVFPVAGIVSGHCACRFAANCPHPGKHPLLQNGLYGATTDPPTVDRYWRRWPWAGLGIPTGHRSSLLVVDIDPDHGGQRSLDRLTERGLALPDTLSVRTGGGGRHLFYHHPGGRIPNSAGRLPGVADLPGIDLRGDGGYIIAAPSPHISGRRYQWVDTGASLAELPDWAYQRPTPPHTQAKPLVVGEGRIARYAQAALDGEVAAVRTAPEGQRNVTLNRSGFKLGTLVGAGVLDEAAAREALIEAGVVAGLAGSETQASVTSGLSAGMACPRQLEPLARSASPDAHGQVPPPSAPLGEYALQATGLLGP